MASVLDNIAPDDDLTQEVQEELPLQPAEVNL